MPSHYDYKEDNKLHSRYSELRLCTPGGVARVVERRKFQLDEISFNKRNQRSFDKSTI